MMSVTDIEITAQLDKFDERQGIPLEAGESNADPAIPGARVQRIEITIKII